MCCIILSEADGRNKAKTYYRANKTNNYTYNVLLLCIAKRHVVMEVVKGRAMSIEYFNNVHCNQCSACEVLVHEICTSEAPKCTHER